MFKFLEFIEHKSIIAYVTFAMFISWIVQMVKARTTNAKLRDKVVDSFVCSLFTASICLPLLDTFPQLPTSICLLIGGFIGTLGFRGVENFLKDILMALLKKAFGNNFHLKDLTNHNTINDVHSIEDEEPPLLKRSKTNASK